MRIATNDAPVVWTGTADLDAHVPYGQYLVTVTEFGVQLAYREESYDTWSPPLLLTEAPR